MSMFRAAKRRPGKLNKLRGARSISDKEIKEIADYTQSNNELEGHLVLAKAIKDRQMVRIIEALQVLLDAAGHNGEIKDAINKWTKANLARAKAVLPKEQYEKVHDAF